MKTKIKMIAFLEIAVVLCSLFLVALPTIAAEQTAQTITASSENDYVLDIYGNANEDDTIDMRDLTYVKLIFFGKKPETELADAKYDGKINPLDFIQIKLIIVGNEKELTVVDTYGGVVTVRKPVKRVITEYLTSLQAMRVLDAEDMIVGIGMYTKKTGPTFLQDLADLPLFGSVFSPDYEAILSLNPDLFVGYSAAMTPGGRETFEEKLPGVTVFWAGYYSPYNPKNLTMDMRKLGYILDRRDQAEEYIDWYNGYLDMIKERTAGLSDDEKPRVYIESAYAKYNCMTNFRLCDIAGGINICAGLENPAYFATTVDPEWVIEQNPDCIMIASRPYQCGGYETDDPTCIKEEIEAILNRPELANVAAVKEGRAYIWYYQAIGIFPNNIILIAYIAKWLHPDLFEELDPQAIHQEYLDRFSPMDFNVKEHGVFVYPEPS
jgi:iron complex transport system substrate-binding protein